MSRTIKIFDTTLRDGEQSPGASMNMYEKLEIARILAKLNVDVIEAGFPISSDGDFNSVKTVAEEIKGVSVCGLSRALEKDIDRCWEAVKYSDEPRIHTFIATSPVHMKFKLKQSPDKVLDRAVSAVKYAKKYTPYVEFSAEDASRSDKDFLVKIFAAVIDAGAVVINVPDTVGYAIPGEFGSLIKYLSNNVTNIDKATISVHCHNDLGLATANSLSAVANGAGQVECTINGIGERAGNAALEEIVMSIKTRKDLFNCKTNIQTKNLYQASRTLVSITGLELQRNKAIVGLNAFSHEAGIHQDGVIKERTTYEIMKPEDIGLVPNTFVLGKHSGRHAFIKKLKEMNIELSSKKVEEVFNRFKTLADKKKEVYDEDILALVQEQNIEYQEMYKLIHYSITSGDETTPSASVKLVKETEELEFSTSGDGPVDAIFNCINKIVNLDIELIDYSIRSVSKGTDAIGEVMVQIKIDDSKYNGQGTSTDIIEASARAYLNAINKYYSNANTDIAIHL